MCLTGNAHPHWEWGCASPGIHILTGNGGCALPGMRTSSPAVETCLTENAHPHRECTIIIYYSPYVFRYNIYIFKKTNIPSKAELKRLIIVGVNKNYLVSHCASSSSSFAVRILRVLPTAEATNLLIKTTEASSKGRLIPPSNNKTFLCGSTLAIKSDIVMPSV